MTKPENVSTTSRPSSVVDEEVMGAARSGDIEMLYRLIREDADVLERFSTMKFVETPLHIAAAEGKTDFAIEMMYLQPSFATKLNADGLSPLHLAVQNKHIELGLSLLEIDRSLVSVKGKKGYTPFHFLAMKGKGDDLIKLLKKNPDCFRDVTGRDETALHVAARNKDLTALKYLLDWLLETTDYGWHEKQAILDSKDRDGETVLHISVSRAVPDPETLRLLNDHSIDIKAKNSKNQTALDILNGRNQVNIGNCVDILRHPSCPRKTLCKCFKMINQWEYEIKHLSAERGNALLVVTVLILTATYQAALSPPGGVREANVTSSNNKISHFQIYCGSKNSSSTHVVENMEIKAQYPEGLTVLKPQAFLWFFIPNLVAFVTAFFLTCLVLASLLDRFFLFTLYVSLSMLLFCLLDALVNILSPNKEASYILISPYFIATSLFFIPLSFPIWKLFLKNAIKWTIPNPKQ